MGVQQIDIMRAQQVPRLCVSRHNTWAVYEEQLRMYMDLPVDSRALHGQHLVQT